MNSNVQCRFCGSMNGQVKDKSCALDVVSYLKFLALSGVCA